LASLTAKIRNSFILLSGWRVRTLCVGALALGGVAFAQTVEDEREALARAKAQSILAERRAAKLEALAEEQSGSAEQVRAKAAAVAARIQATEADVTAAESRISIIERMQEEQQQRLAAKQEPAVRLVAALQTLARRPPALSLVQPGTVSDLVHVRAALSSILPAVQARTADLKVEIARGQGLRRDAGRALASLESAQQRLDEQRAALLTVFAQRRAVADATIGQALSEQDKSIAMTEKARNITQLLDQVAKDGQIRDRLTSLPGPRLRPSEGGVENMPSLSAQTMNSSIPYRLPASGVVVQGVGDLSTDGVRSRGLTLAVRPSAQIVAPSGGTVVFAGVFKGYGRIVIIDHGGGWTSAITSLASLDVREGDSVLQGSPIGRAIDEQPRITVELRQANRPIDITGFVG
jgi:murein hydrolase activator